MIPPSPEKYIPHHAEIPAITRDHPGQRRLASRTNLKGSGIEMCNRDGFTTGKQPTTAAPRVRETAESEEFSSHNGIPDRTNVRPKIHPKLPENMQKTYKNPAPPFQPENRLVSLIFPHGPRIVLFSHQIIKCKRARHHILRLRLLVWEKANRKDNLRVKQRLKQNCKQDRHQGCPGGILLRFDQPA